MKKYITFLIVLFLSLVPLTSALAMDTQANIRADFIVWDERNNPDATGFAIFNYVKGRGAWNITGKVYNMRPDDYTLSVGIGGTCVGNSELVNFTVGSDGYGYFHMVGATLPDKIDIARIYKQGVPGCPTELTSTEDSDLLKLRGGGRINDNRKW